MSLQIAVSLLLVIGAGLFVRTLSNLHAIDVGFNRENILLVSINGRQAGYRDAALARFYSGLLDRFREIPGVRAASASNFPLVANYINNDSIFIPGRAPQPGDPSANLLNVDAAFLETMQIPVLLGRGLEPGDLASPTVAVVNQKFASTFFGARTPSAGSFRLGKAADPFSRSSESPRRRITIRCRRRASPWFMFLIRRICLELRQFVLRIPHRGPAVERRGGSPPHRARRQSSVSIDEITTQAQRMEQTISQQRTFAELGSCFAVLALLIACVGLYGAMAYTVARRTGEIGIRMALGAQRPGIIWMVLREVLASTAVGWCWATAPRG